MKKLFTLPFLLCIALLAACIETDISVPGFPDMMRYFSATEAEVQLTMSMNFIGFCLAGLFLGPLSDSFGRRPVMLMGNTIFLIGAIGTVTATSLPVLIAWRFFQGMGASAAFTLFVAMIADAYQGEKASKLINRLNGILTAAMAGAPILGGILVESLGWRSTFSSVALLCLVATLLLGLFLPETNQQRQPFIPLQIIKNFWRVSSSSAFLTLSLVPTLLCAGYMAFVAGAVFFYTDELQISLTQFTLHQGAVICAFSATSFFGGQITTWLKGSRNSVISGCVFTLIGAFWLLLCAALHLAEPYLFTVGMALYSTGVALCYGATFTGSMEVFPELRGAASSISVALRLIVVALAIWAVGALYDHTFMPIAALLAFAAVSSTLLAMPILLRPTLRKLLA